MINDKLKKVIKALYLPNMMQVDELLTIFKEDIIYKISNILKLANIFKNEPTNYLDKEENNPIQCNKLL